MAIGDGKEQSKASNIRCHPRTVSCNDKVTSSRRSHRTKDTLLPRHPQNPLDCPAKTMMNSRTMPNSQAGWKPKLQVINRWRAGSRYGDTRATNEDISDEDDARWLLKSTAVLDSALCKHRQQTERRVNKLSSWAADAEALEPSMRTSNTPEGIPRRLGDQICTMRNSGAEWRTHPDNETKHQLQKHPEPHMRTTRTLDTFEGISWTKKESSHLPPLSGDGAPKSFLFSTTMCDCHEA